MANPAGTRTLRRRGFTLLELVIVIVVVGLLVGLGSFAYQAVVDRSKQATTNAQIQQIVNVIIQTRHDQGKTLNQITNSYCSSCACQSVSPAPVVSDPGFAATPCGVACYVMLNRLSPATGMSLAELQKLFTDPDGRTGTIDENETEPLYHARDKVRDLWTSPPIVNLVPYYLSSS